VTVAVDTVLRHKDVLQCEIKAPQILKIARDGSECFGCLYDWGFLGPVGHETVVSHRVGLDTLGCETPRRLCVKSRTFNP
jgi:hypothetical protein